MPGEVRHRVHDLAHLYHPFRTAPFARRWNDGAFSKPGSAYGTYRAVWQILLGIKGGEKEPVTSANRTDEFHSRYDASRLLAAPVHLIVLAKG